MYDHDNISALEPFSRQNAIRRPMRPILSFKLLFILLAFSLIIQRKIDAVPFPEMF